MTTNDSVAKAPPSSRTVSEIIEVPECPAAGFKVIIRLAPLPLTVTLPCGNNAVLEEAAVTIRFAAESLTIANRQANSRQRIAADRWWGVLVLDHNVVSGTTVEHVADLSAPDDIIAKPS